MQRREWQLVLIMAVMWGAKPGEAQLVPEFTHPKSTTCCPTLQAQALVDRVQAVANQAQDWAELSYYHAETQYLAARLRRGNPCRACGLLRGDRG